MPATVALEAIQVLILILMEDTLRGTFFQVLECIQGLNPCFNGRYSQSLKLIEQAAGTVTCLNPCFNGRYSQSYRKNMLS